MAVKKIKKPKTTEPKLRFTVNHALAGIYVFLLFTILPLFQSKLYSATRRDKFALFIILTLVAGVSVGAVTLANYLSRNNEYNKRLNTYRDPFKLSITDIGLGAFLIVSLISTLFSKYRSTCFIAYHTEEVTLISKSGTGITKEVNSGRNMGLLMILMIVICYLVISRFFFSKKFVYYGIFLGITLVVGLAILNYHRIDPLGIFEKYANNQNVQQNFTSTIGNKNYLSALVCVSLMFSFGMAIVTKDLVMRIVAFLSTAIQFMGLLVATSDGGFLGFFAGMAVLLIIASRDAKRLMWYFLGLFIMMASAKVLSIFQNSSKGYTSFSDLFLNSGLTYIVLAISAGLFALLFILGNKNENFCLPSFLFFIVIGIIGAAVTAVIGLFVYYSVIDTTSVIPKDDFRRFFRFDDKWGTHRGLFWNRAFDIFGDMNFFEKLFGCGPETFYFKYKPYNQELYNLHNEFTNNSAHNVYINYLITHGILGLSAYLTFIGAAIVRAFKNAKENPLAYICLGVMAAYAAQDIVNIANPLNVSWFIAFIAISEACVLKANRSNQLITDKF